MKECSCMQLVKLLLTLVVAAAVGGGCASLLTKQAAPDSPIIAASESLAEWSPVGQVATTNDTDTIAALRVLMQVNRQFNPTPSSPIVDVIAGALIAILTAAGGWHARSRALKKPDEVQK